MFHLMPSTILRIYGIQQGLIFMFPPTASIIKGKPEKWFRVGVMSPDDLDKDLDFIGGEVIHYHEVYDFIKRMNKTGVFYDEVLNNIQAHVKAGKRTS
jgi:hypothetical protein